MNSYVSVIQHPLATLFPEWKLDRRDLIWLWWQMREAINLSTEDCFSLSAQSLIAQHLSPAEAEALREEKQRAMLPASKLPQVQRSPRAIRWMLNEYRKMPAYPWDWLPTFLSDWERLVALVDIEHVSLETKLSRLQHWERSWTETILEDRHFRWLQGPDERGRCQAAWEWYHNSGHPKPIGQPFKNYDEVAIYWDTQDWRLDEKRHHLEQIQKYRRNLLTKKNQVGKKQTNLLLSEEAKEALQRLAEDSNMTLTKVVEWLLETEMKRRKVARDASSSTVG